MPGGGKPVMPKLIAVTGPESTGKSWLSRQLASTFNAIRVDEYAREYLAGIGRPYTINDVEQIAIQQFQNNLKAAQLNNLVVADTEVLVCYVWSKFVFGHVPESIVQLLDKQYFDLYLLCNVDLPWEYDPMREHPHARTQLFEMYESELKKRSWPYRLVTGTGNQRLAIANEIVNQLLNE